MAKIIKVKVHNVTQRKQFEIDLISGTVNVYGSL